MSGTEAADTVVEAAGRAVTAAETAGRGETKERERGASGTEGRNVVCVGWVTPVGAVGTVAADSATTVNGSEAGVQLAVDAAGAGATATATGNGSRVGKPIPAR